MTVPVSTRKSGPYNGNGVATVFAFDFKVFAKEDIRVVYLSTAGVESDLVLDSDYSVTLNPDQEVDPGGDVTTLAVAPIASGTTLTIVGNIEFEQPLDITNGGGFFPQVIEDELDRLTMLIQQTNEKAETSFRLPVSAPAGISTEIPLPEANAIVAWNETADALQNIDPGTLATIVAFGTAQGDVFTGDGVTTTFALSFNPGALFNLDVSIGGVTQLPTVDYAWPGGTVFTTAVAVPNGVKMLVRYLQGLAQGATDSAASTFLQAGTGAVATTVSEKLQRGEFKDVFDFLTAVEKTNVATLGTTDVSSKIIAADAAVSAAGGGCLMFPQGTYKFSGDLTPSAGVEWIGQGTRQYMPKLKAADSTARVLITNTCNLKNFYIEGSVSTPGALVGTGLQVGSTAHVGHVEISNVFIRYFQTGLRLAAALWTRFEACQFEYNRVGVDFNAGSGSMYSTTVMFDGCVSANNERNGIGSTSVPVRNIGIRWIGGSVENNGASAPATYPQIALGSVGNFEIDTYIEYTLGGTKPDAINSNGLSQGEISVYINGAANGIRDVSGGMSDVSINACTFNSITTRNIDCASEARVTAFSNGDDGSAASANVLTGTGSKDLGSNKFSNSGGELTHTPTLTGTTGSAAHTYVWQSFFYTRVDDRIHFNGAVRISAKDAGMTGSAQITLPVASVNSTTNKAIVSVMCDNVTLSANKSHVIGKIDENTSVIALYEQSNNGGASTALPSANIQATTIIYYSGSYKVA